MVYNNGAETCKVAKISGCSGDSMVASGVTFFLLDGVSGEFFYSQVNLDKAIKVSCFKKGSFLWQDNLS